MKDIYKNKDKSNISCQTEDNILGEEIRCPTCKGRMQYLTDSTKPLVCEKCGKFASFDFNGNIIID